MYLMDLDKHGLDRHAQERDKRGRFAPGCKPGPGRQPLTLELDRLNPKLEQRKLIRWLQSYLPHPERFTAAERDLIIARLWSG